MIQFLITVTCATSLGMCPIPGGTYTAKYPAKDVHSCIRGVEAKLVAYRQEPKQFHIRCDPIQ